MANLEDIKRKAQSAAYTTAEKAKEAAAFASEKAVALKDATKVRVSLINEKRKLEKCYQALGEWFAAQYGDDVPEGAEDIVKAVRASQEKIAELQTLKGEKEFSPRELMDKGVGFIAEKAEALAALARKPSEGAKAQELVDEGVEAFAEKAEAVAEEAGEPADIGAAQKLVDEGVEAFAEKAEAVAEEAGEPADVTAAQKLVDEGIEAAADWISGEKNEPEE